MEGVSADTSAQMQSLTVRRCVDCKLQPRPNACHAPAGHDLSQTPTPVCTTPYLLTEKGPLQATLEERLNRSEETRKTFRHFLTEVARGSENTKNGRNIPAKVRSAREKHTGLPCFASQ